MVIDRRFLIEESIDEVIGEMKTVLDKVKGERPNFSYEMREMMRVLPTMYSPNETSTYFQALEPSE